ncbi:CYTH domain-containing protein [Planomicrobium sp. YIM 101495]|uniref:CYTH domain-containing protein n=1 Tax=Planomicrobium sp. YIM 101495 TaxID=2665160 RepID=UPI0012B72C1A|nr:CYTH domain-containing protein [Planomicrobium sp. YIM 101495]MTD30449.1 CYTH domain-containing protein [Planomicrobium sp. YIM 101495]
MGKELEIEFKNMLTRVEYDALLEAFRVTPEQIATQTNHYFDTAEHRLKRQQCALRIRVLPDRLECTLKTPAPDGNYEWTDHVTEDDLEALTNGRSIQAPTVATVLDELGVAWHELQSIGSLTTHRAEIPYEDGLLAIDHSEYAGTEDFEVEYEVTDAKSGQQLFNKLLEKHGIPARHAKKKIARFAKYAAEKAQGR